MNGKAIFIKYWLVGEPLLSSLPYYTSILPGLKEGISGTLALARNMGIIKNISEEKKNATIEVVKYFTSKKNHENIIEKGMRTLVLPELLTEEKGCKTAPCELIEKIQFTGEPSFILDNDESENYRKIYQKYIYQFLYKNKTVEETLKKFDDLTKIYTISLDTEHTYIGLICFIFISVISLLMLLSLIFLFNDNFSPFFKFLPPDLWIITVLGSIIILWIPFINYGQTETFKCHLKPLLLCIGYTLNICPSMCMLISQFPEIYKTTTWITEHKYIYLLLNILIDVLLSSISLINPYIPSTIMAENGENFEICKYNGEYSIIILIAYKLLVILLLLFLIFVEWNLSDTLYDLKFIILTQYISILSIILIAVTYFIQIRNYKIYFLIQTINVFTISIANYIILFGIRLCLAFLKKQNAKLQFINNINEKFINNDSHMQTQTQSCYDKTTTKANNNNICKSNAMEEYEDYDNYDETNASSSQQKSFISRMINYHYSTESYCYSYSTKNATSKSSYN